MTKTIFFVIAALLGLIILVGCGRWSSDLPDELEGRFSRYLPITVADQFKLTFGFHNPSERSDFDEPALAVIYQVLSELTPFDGALPWEEDISLFVYGSGIILHVTNATHTIEIAFTPQRYLGRLDSGRNFVRVLIDNALEQWFTIESDSSLKIFGLLR